MHSFSNTSQAIPAISQFNDDERQSCYIGLFDGHLSADTLESIIIATNKAWVLVSDHFKLKIEQQTKRRVDPTKRGGDRKSESVVDKLKINYSDHVDFDPIDFCCG